jgi:hypothetical protein
MKIRIIYSKKMQKGNVLFIILLAVSLFAALTYAVSDSFRGGTSTITESQAEIAADKILRDMASIRQGFEYLWNQQGCSIDDISFANPATPPHQCDIFHPEGAGISYPNYLEQYQDSPPSQVGVFSYVGPWHWAHGTDAGNYRIIGLGTDAQDLMLHFNFVDEKICTAVNRQVDRDIIEIPNEPLAENDGDIGAGVETSVFAGKTYGCFRKNSPTFGTFNQIFFAIQEF